MRNHKLTEGACSTQLVRCFLDNINNTKVLLWRPNKGSLVFSSSFFLFPHIFLLSHTFVDILCCLGQMYVRDHLSVLSCLLSTAGDFYWGVGISLHCRPVFSFFFGVCSAFIRCLLMLYPHCIWSRVHLLRTKIKSVSPLIFLQHTKFEIFFLKWERGVEIPHSPAYSLEGTT